jgi:hypothetical protein
VSDFKGRHFEGEIVLWAVRWYCRYGVSYRDLEQMGPDVRSGDREAPALAVAPAALDELARR